jgi:hypothetical protein
MGRRLTQKNPTVSQPSPPREVTVDSVWRRRLGNGGIVMSLHRLHIGIYPEGPTDLDELSRLTRRLRADLLSLDVETVDMVKAVPAPDDAKAGDAIEWGQLAVALVASGGILTTLISAIQSWLTRSKANAVVIEIGGDRLELRSTSLEEQSRIVDAWIQRQAKD